MTTLNVVRLPHADGLSPLAYQTDGASGFDLYAAVDAPITLAPGRSCLAPTGFIFEIPAGFEGQIRARSGLSSRIGLTVLNGPGTIDSDYRGEVKVILINHGQDPIQIDRGMRVAQMVITPVARVTICETLEASISVRGGGGFGSTGC